MSENAITNLINLIISNGNQILKHISQAHIFRSSLAYIGQNIHEFLVAMNPESDNPEVNLQAEGLQQLQDLFAHFDLVITHLSEEKWIQPALNWPPQYVHKYIDNFRDNLKQVLPKLNFQHHDITIEVDEDQDQTNKCADLLQLKEQLESLLDKIDITDAVGVQYQVLAKLSIIQKILPKGISSSSRSLKRRPTSEASPVISMKKRIEELLIPYKNINIENDDLDLKTVIGNGAFGKVYQAIRLSTAQIVAVKELRSDCLTSCSWASLYAEVETMAAVRHQYLLELIGAHITEPYRIITSLCLGKSLFDRIHQPNEQYPSLSQTRLTIIAYQVAVGMAHLHSLNIVHRDLKTSNILIDEDEDCRVADFGLSGIMKDDQELIGGVGTPHYTAPEVLAHARYGPKVDSFSYAVVLWEMLNKQIPYGDMTHKQIFDHVVTRNWRLPIQQKAPEGLKKLITRCWSKNPNDRPDFNEIVSMFENKEIFFPESDQNIDFESIKSIKKFPPIDYSFAISSLMNPTSEHFSSIIHYIYQHCDEKVRSRLREKNILETLLSAFTEFISTSPIQNTEKDQGSLLTTSNDTFTNSNPLNIDAILVLASVLLNDDEYSDFLRRGGLEMFKLCVESAQAHQISAALRFGIKVPLSELEQMKPFIPKLVSYLGHPSSTSTLLSNTLKFVSRFNIDELKPFSKEISFSLLSIVDDATEQATVDAVVSLIPLCFDSIAPISMQQFYRLLTGEFTVPASFIQALIQSSTKSSHLNLIMSILKGSQKADKETTTIFLDFLQHCQKNESDIFKNIYKYPQFLQIIQTLLDYSKVNQYAARAPLFILYCTTPNENAVSRIAVHPVLHSLINMKSYYPQRLQILTALCLHETFCQKMEKNEQNVMEANSHVQYKIAASPSKNKLTTINIIDGLVRLLVDSLSRTTLVGHAVRLICALSNHPTGCRILSTNEILELFTQLFLTSSSGDLATSHMILKNIARNGYRIPQGPLLVSCLMQDINDDIAKRCMILSTLYEIVKTNPSSVQENDLHRCILGQIASPLTTFSSKPGTIEPPKRKCALELEIGVPLYESSDSNIKSGAIKMSSSDSNILDMINKNQSSKDSQQSDLNGRKHRKSILEPPQDDIDEQTKKVYRTVPEGQGNSERLPKTASLRLNPKEQIILDTKIKKRLRTNTDNSFTFEQNLNADAGNQSNSSLRVSPLQDSSLSKESPSPPPLPETNNSSSHLNKSPRNDSPTTVNNSSSQLNNSSKSDLPSQVNNFPTNESSSTGTNSQSSTYSSSLTHPSFISSKSYQALTNENLLFIYLSLQLFTVVEDSILRNIHSMLLEAIYEILDEKNNLYPEIVESCLCILIRIAKNVNISGFLKRAEIIPFVNQVIELIPEEDQYKSLLINDRNEIAIYEA